MMRTSPFRIGSLLSRKNSTPVAQSSTSAADVGPRFQARDSTDGGPGTAGYEGIYKVSDREVRIPWANKYYRDIEQPPSKGNDS